MDKFKIIFLLVFMITTAIIPILINEEKIILAQLGVILTNPENVTNQTLQGYPSDDRNMSTGLEE
jgi:hypothetical protein